MRFLVVLITILGLLNIDLIKLVKVCEKLRLKNVLTYGVNIINVFFGLVASLIFKKFLNSFFDHPWSRG